MRLTNNYIIYEYNDTDPIYAQNVCQNEVRDYFSFERFILAQNAVCCWNVGKNDWITIKYTR